MHSRITKLHTSRGRATRTAVAAATVGATAIATLALGAGASASPAPGGHAAVTPAGHGPGKHGGGGIDAEVTATMRGMTMDEKLGQMFVTYAYGDSATTTDPQDTKQNQQLYGVNNGAELVRKYHLGGVIYFTWANGLTSPTQIAHLSNGLQQSAMTGPERVPLLLSTDQEGGEVTRIGAPAAVSPGNMAIGATWSPLDAFNSSRVTGTELRAMGLNVDDAPVVDVNTNPNNSADGSRSFGDNSIAVSVMAAASVLGYRSADVAPTAKHFPGLGSTSVNTDNGIAVTHETKAQFERNDLPPFRAAIAAGIPMIMAAHIVAPALDPSGAPASLSHPIVTGLLRKQLHFNGVVITDALSAAALQNVPVPQRSVQAVEAGDDELLMPTDLAGSIAAVKAAVADGTIPASRIDQSVRRILTLKYKLGLFDNPYTTDSAVSANVGTPSQLATMQHVADRSMTLVKNDGTLPLAKNSGKHVLVTGYGVTTTQTLVNDMTPDGVVPQRVVTGYAPTPAAIAAAVAAAKSNDLTVVVTNDAWGDPAQQSLVNQLIATGKPVVSVSVAAPYDIAYFTGVNADLAAFGYQPNSLQAIVDTLFGANPTGRLPVTIPLANQPGTTLYRIGTGLHYSR